MPHPPTEMPALSFFLGTFEGPGETRAESMFGKHALRRTIDSYLDLDDFWLFMRFRDSSSEPDFSPIRGNWQLTYDSSQRVFVALWTDNLGHWAPSTSPGWQGDTLIFVTSSVAGDNSMSVRDTFVRKSENGMLMTVDYKKDGGNWVRSIDYDLRKVAG